MYIDRNNIARLNKGRLGVGKFTALPVVRVCVYLLVCILCGCSGNHWRPADNPLSINGQMESIWQISQTELKSHGFELDRLDLRSGVIETLPLVSKQWFEFWRNDVVDGKSLAQASLHTIRRQVRLELLQDGDKYNLQCRVRVEKLSNKPLVTGGKAQARQVFTAATYKKQKDLPQQWVAFDDDHALEREILCTIAKKLGNNWK